MKFDLRTENFGKKILGQSFVNFTSIQSIYQISDGRIIITRGTYNSRL